MIKIGDFSKLAHVTVKTLRYYAKVGMLKPARIDRFTGYRYYTLDQLSRLNRILALKNLGFSLEQIAAVTNSDLSVEKLHSMLCKKQEELQRRLQTEQDRLSQVKARIQQIELEGSLPQREILLKRVPAQPVLSLRRVIESLDSLPYQAEEMHTLLCQSLTERGIRKDCPWMILQHNTEYTERKVDVEIAVFLDSDGIAKLQRVYPEHGMVKILPGIETTASLLVTGEHDDLVLTYAELYGWMQTNGYRVAGSSREVHLCAKEPDLSLQKLIEIQVPVEKIPIQINTISGKEQEMEMEPKFITKPAFLVAGSLYQGKNQNGEIPDMWGTVFLPRIHEIKRVDPEVCYGVCYMEEGLPDGEFCYIAGCEVRSETDVPAGMTLYKVPEQRYAVFEHHGTLENLGKTFEYISQSWLPRSGYKQAGGPELEVYDRDFKPDSPESILYIYIPIAG